MDGVQEMSRSGAIGGPTPLTVIANVTRVVTTAADRVTGDRNDYPLLVAAVCAEALELHGIKAQVLYGDAAWIEILEDQTALWAGCWGEHHHFWVVTSNGETVDLNTSVSRRKAARETTEGTPVPRPIHSPPILWSPEVPSFYRYRARGAAEADPDGERDRGWLELLREEIRRNCGPDHLDPEDDPRFPNEPVICPGRRVLDDTKQSFRHFDRALSVMGLPGAPF